MCRSIKTLRPPYADDVTDADIEAAALQYVRKVAGMRRPAPHNQQAFDTAVAAVTRATQTLLGDVRVRPTAERSGRAAARAGQQPSARRVGR